MALDLLDIQNDVYKYEASAGVMKEVIFFFFEVVPYVLYPECTFYNFFFS